MPATVPRSSLAVSSASMVFLNVGVSLLSLIFLIFDRAISMLASTAGMKCSGSILSNGGVWYGVSKVFKSGLFVFCAMIRVILFVFNFVIHYIKHNEGCSKIKRVR